MAANERTQFRTERAQAADMEGPGLAWQLVAVGSARFPLLSLFFLPMPHCWQPVTLLRAPGHCHRWASSAGIARSCMRIKCGHWDYCRCCHHINEATWQVELVESFKQYALLLGILYLEFSSHLKKKCGLA